ncbi:MAG: hypothetical protein K9H14_05965 [Actinomycetia bacterium]|nr:hypothetical protein [Actinomycetes bacterium]
MKKVSKKIHIVLFFLLLMIILLYVIGCSNTSSNASDRIESSVSKDQAASADSIGNNKNDQEGVPLPQDEANGIYIDGDYAFVADYMKGLYVYDISDRLNPIKISEIELPGDGMDVFVLGKFAYVACGYEGLNIIDISDIKNMKVLSTFKQDDFSSDYAKRMQIKDDILFLADGVGGFKIIDISMPYSPRLISKFGSTYQGSIDDVGIDGDTAFLADYRAGFILVDIKDLNNPGLVSEIRTTGMAKGLCIIERNEDKSYVMVADYKSIQVIDVSDISKPLIAGNYDGLKNVVSITSSGNTAFAADYNLGLVQLDITEITRPILINTFDTGKTNDVCIYEGYIYAVGEKGISVFAIE